MDYLKITKENIDKEHICCAMSNNQSQEKKKWLKERLDEGLVFLKSVERGKCFIEYIPAENAWIPIDANNYIYINCLWVAGSMKGHGYSNDLLDSCIKEAKEEGKSGLCILSSANRKKEFLSDPSYLRHKGFSIADKTDKDIVLMYLPFSNDAAIPKFKDCAKKMTINEDGWVVYYTDQCPFAYYWAARVKEVAKENGIILKVYKIVNKEQAQNMAAPVTTYALFKDGKFITHAIQSDKKFLDLANKLK